MIVVDAPAVIEVLLNTSSGARVAARLFGEGETLHALVTRDAKLASFRDHDTRIEPI